MKTTAFIVADWFIAHNNAVVRYNSADNISNLKIQKLLYYAQGCSLASLKEPLFDEEIMAWKHGPVVESVYRKYHQYGSRGIDETPALPVLDNKLECLLINTYNAFARYSAWELANLTHREDPWKLTPINHPIPLVLIKNYFSVHYMDVNQPSIITENIEQLREIADLEENWDGEDGLAFGKDFIQELIDLVSTMQLQPDIGPTGRGSIDFEYGSRKKGHKYLDLEIYEKDRRVVVYSKDETGASTHEEIEMEDINALIDASVFM